MTWRRVAGVLFAASLLSCDGGPVPVKRLASAGKIGDFAPIVARVGDLAIPASLVAESARARNVDARAALASLADDAVAANAALARELDTRPDVRRSLDAALARQVLRRIRASAVARGPVNDDELRALTAAHWKDVDLPERVRVVHAVVLRKKDARNATDEARASRVAEAIRSAVSSDATADAFEKDAKSVPTDGFEVRVERLPAFAEDGRITDREVDGAMDATFAKAAFQVAVGGTSTVVATPFGWHVIHVLERLPAEQIPAERRREMFLEECIANRARQEHDALVAELKRRADPKIETYAEAALASLPLTGSAPTVGVAQRTSP